MSIVHRQQVNIVVTLLSVIEHISVLNNYTNTWRGLSVMCLNIGIVTCGPNEALIISGLFQSTEGTLVVGGRAIVLPGTILMWFKLKHSFNLKKFWQKWFRVPNTTEDSAEHHDLVRVDQEGVHQSGGGDICGWHCPSQDQWIQWGHAQVLRTFQSLAFTWKLKNDNCFWQVCCWTIW